VRVAIFGVGKYYIKRRDEVSNLLAKDTIVAFFDNKFDNDTEVDGILAMNPININLVKFDCIIIMSTYVGEIYCQLCKLGVDKDKIYTWKQYRSKKTGGIIEEYHTGKSCNGKRVLIVTQPIHYDGGSMAAVYAAMALRQRNYCVWIVAELIEPELKERLLRDGISLAVCQDIPYFGHSAKKWVCSFSVILVNVFPNIHSAYELGKIKPLVWWLHESDVYGNIYQKVFATFPYYRDNLKIDTVNVVAVSENARNNFKRYYPNIDAGIMAYGLPDEREKAVSNNKKMIFAIIGYISLLKGQDILIEAIKKMSEEERNKAEFWFIGSTESDFAQKILQEAKMINSVVIKGVLNRLQMKKILSEVDVVVSASREDSLPIVITEGMMNSKACIMSNVIGNVDYVTNFKDGIIFQSESVDDLKDKICWCLNHGNEVKNIGKEARKIYENEFTMQDFADRLEREIKRAEDLFYGM